jgi:hypothetical protein
MHLKDAVRTNSAIYPEGYISRLVNKEICIKAGNYFDYVRIKQAVTWI